MLVQLGLDSADKNGGNYHVMVSKNGNQWLVVYTGPEEKALVVMNGYLRVGYNQEPEKEEKKR